MQNGTADTPKITVGDYERMATGGWAGLALGSLGSAALLTAGLTTDVVFPTGLAGIAVGALILGAILLVGRLVLRKLDRVRVELEDHKADHQVVQIDAEHLAEIRNHMARVLAFMAKRELEDQKVERLSSQVEEFLEWRAAAEERLAANSRRLAALVDDDVIDIETVRELKQLSERRKRDEL